MASRIWGISIEGQSFHTKESLLKYLNGHDVYGGMAVKDVNCSGIREDMRHSFDDISWVSVELKGSKIFIKLKEAQLINKEKKKKNLQAL